MPTAGHRRAPGARRIAIGPVDFAAVRGLRERFRGEADCQIVHDSALSRGLADAWLLRLEGEVAGYGGVWNRYFPGRVVEFYVLEPFRGERAALFEAFLSVTGATAIEAQTNMPAMRALLEAFGGSPVEEKVLFRDGGRTTLAYPGAVFRRRRPGDTGPDGGWVVELGGAAVAGGGVLTHYNPPFGDIHMEVASSHRRRGLGSYVVQELRRVSREAGLVPAARCDPGNVASWRTLERGGMVECGRLLWAAVRGPGGIPRAQRPV